MRIAAVLCGIGLLLAAADERSAVGAQADDVRVMCAGAVAPAYLKLVAQFEQTTRHKVVTLATATGVGPDSIPNRVRRGEPVDVIILSASAIDELIKDGHVVSGSKVDLAKSGTGMAVRAGATKPRAKAGNPQAARARIEYLASSAARPGLKASGLDQAKL
jgi:molybdate transport system substrate-binding protein